MRVARLLPTMLLIASQYGSVAANDYRPSDTVFTAEEVNRFASIGRVECLTVRNTIFASTAFHLGSYKTMATNARAFRDPQTGSKLNPLTCTVRFYDDQGVVREEASVVAYHSRWEQLGMNFDPSNDVALIRLARETGTTGNAAAQVVYKYSLKANEEVSMAGFRGELDTPNKHILRRTIGEAQIAPPDNATLLKAKRVGLYIKNPETLAVANFNSGKGTSGAPVYNSGGKIIGINMGGLGGGGRFDPRTNFNMFILFDKRIGAEFKILYPE